MSNQRWVLIEKESFRQFSFSMEGVSGEKETHIRLCRENMPYWGKSVEGFLADVRNGRYQVDKDKTYVIARLAVPLRDEAEISEVFDAMVNSLSGGVDMGECGLPFCVKECYEIRFPSFC